ncbi:uncharacterized protein DS421_7g218600 [Arachis hypogaea]|nr:uncharacterized protein DS421_7g218600 [Arachis hypogaea]
MEPPSLPGASANIIFEVTCKRDLHPDLAISANLAKLNHCQPQHLQSPSIRDIVLRTLLGYSACHTYQSFFFLITYPEQVDNAVASYTVTYISIKLIINSVLLILLSLNQPHHQTLLDSATFHYYYHYLLIQHY